MKLVIKGCAKLGVMFGLILVIFFGQITSFAGSLYAGPPRPVNYNFDNSDATDSDTTGNPQDDGTVVGDVTFVDGYSGKAASFNGGYITMLDSIVLNTTTFTISMRIKTSTTAGAVLIGYQADTPTGSISGAYIPILYIKKDGKLVGCLWIGSDLSVTTTSVVNDNNWHKIDLYATTSSITLYVDSVYIGGSTGTVNHLGMTKNQLGTGVDTALANRITGTDGWVSYVGLMDDFVFKYGTTVSPATIATNDASSVSLTSATFNGNITANGGADVTDRGFVYSSTNTAPAVGGTGVTQVSSGSGTGSYNTTQSSLASSTTYYYQAYATNSSATSYGGVKSFTTSSSPASSSPASSVTQVVDAEIKAAEIPVDEKPLEDYGNTRDEFITYLYNRVLARHPEEMGKNTWSERLENKSYDVEDTVMDFIFGEEKTKDIKELTDTEFISFLYRSLLGREPETYGYNEWTKRMAKGMTRQKIVEGFIDSEEFGYICKKFGVVLNNKQ